jgi:choline-sulfatase
MSPPPRPPRNVLLICADEFRGDLLAANGLNPDIRTPHLDALARRGVNFKRHFCALPKCVPSRISMMTGRYPHTDGFRTIHQHLPASAPDLARSLQQRGYELAEFGRNHCWQHMLEASHRPARLEPGQRGIAFDHHAWTPPFDDLWKKHHAEAEPLTPQPPDRLEDGRGFVHADNLGWAADLAVTEMAQRFLGDRRDPERPFFCQVNLSHPHPAYRVGEPWFSMYPRDAIEPFPTTLPDPPPYCVQRQREVRTGIDCPEGAFRAIQTTYMGMCSRVDELVGEIVRRVDDAGLWDQTVVLFLSDHGDYAGQYGLPEKWDNHFPDCLMHVPMVLAGAGLPVGRTVETLTSHVDLAPTLCELLGLDPVPGMHGASMTPALDGHATRDAVFADGGHEAALRERFDHYQAHGQPTPTATADDFPPRPHERPGGGDGKQETYRLFPDTMARAKMVRTHRWKYVHRQTGDHELYDLHADRWELRNLYPSATTDNERARVVHELRGRLLDWTLDTDPDRPHQPHVSA